MTPSEARAILGIEPGLDPKALRRAYLRKLKTCKPEVDPEGFARLRGAYELLKDLAAEPVVAPSVPAAIPGARPAAQDPEYRELVPVILAAFGDARPSELADRLACRDDPVAVMGLAALLARRRLTTLAARAQRLALRLASRDGLADTAFVEAAVDILLELQAYGHHAEANALLADLRAWLVETGLELRGGDWPVRWVLLLELHALPGSFPARARELLVEALRSRDLSAGLAQLDRLRHLPRSECDLALDQLKAHAPQLQRAMRGVVDLRALRLREWERREAERFDGSDVLLMFGLVFGGMIFMAVMFWLASDIDDVVEDVRAPMLGVLGGLDWRASGLPDSVRHATEAHYETACQVDPVTWPRDECAMARRTLELSLRNRCAEARPLYRQLAERRAPDDERLSEAVLQVLRRTCGGP